jgi:protein-disulfide isomerase
MVMRRTLALGAGAAVAAALVVASLIGATRGGPPAAAPLAGLGVARSLTSGIPQHGFVLGSPAAPLTIEEFADLQCPYCRRFALEVLPVLVQRYVRTGKARIIFRPLAFIGRDSTSTARLVAAAAAQDGAWELIDLLYRNQGAENGGWATDDLLHDALAGAGLDARRAERVAAGDGAGAALQTAAERAAALGVKATPALVLTRKGHAPEAVANPLDAAALCLTIDAALG